jgi:uncharacterized protein
MRSTYWTCLILTVIGGINWGLIGLFNFDLIAAIFGQMSALSRLIYIAVGIASVVLLALSYNTRHSLRHA